MCTGPFPLLAESASFPVRKTCPLTPWSPWGPCLLTTFWIQGRRGESTKKHPIKPDRTYPNLKSHTLDSHPLFLGFFSQYVIMCEYQVWRISDPKLWCRLLSCIPLFRLAIFFIFSHLFLYIPFSVSSLLSLMCIYIWPRYLTVALLILPEYGNSICKNVGIEQVYCLSHR